MQHPSLSNGSAVSRCLIFQALPHTRALIAGFVMRGRMSGMSESLEVNDRPRRFRFGLRTLLELMAIAAFVLYLVYGYTVRHERYELTIIQPKAGPADVAVLFDRKTGKMWTRSLFSQGQWSTYPMPSGINSK